MADGLRVGFIGCGGNARGHMASVASIPRADIVAVCDIDEPRAEAAAKEHNAKAYADYTEMLDAEQLDAIEISTWLLARGDPEIEVANRGLPFLIEKPVALDRETAARVLEAVRRNDVITSVGYQLRYSGSVRALREFLAGKTVGMAVGRYWCGFGWSNAWQMDVEKSGGQILEQATHTIDLMRYFVGDIDEVYAAISSRIIPDATAPDVNSLTLKFTNGAVGSLTATWAAEPDNWSQANIVDLFVEKRRVTWSGAGIEMDPPVDQSDIPTQTETPSIDEVFLEAVERNDASAILSSYEEGVRSAAVSLAAVASARSGSPEKVADHSAA